MRKHLETSDHGSKRLVRPSRIFQMTTTLAEKAKLGEEQKGKCKRVDKT